MNFEVVTVPLFDKQVKRLAKKYPSLKMDLMEFIENLASNPLQGTPLGNNFYKIRLAIASKGKGKSGEARVITIVKITNASVFLTFIYDKSEKDTLTKKDFDTIFRNFH